MYPAFFFLDLLSPWFHDSLNQRERSQIENMKIFLQYLLSCLMGSCSSSVKMALASRAYFSAPWNSWRRSSSPTTTTWHGASCQRKKLIRDFFLVRSSWSFFFNSLVTCKTLNETMSSLWLMLSCEGRFALSALTPLSPSLIILWTDEGISKTRNWRNCGK